MKTKFRKIFYRKRKIMEKYDIFAGLTIQVSRENAGQVLP